MKILITGGAGFIGHNLSRLALNAGHDVRVLDDLSTGYRENLAGLDVEFREGSLVDARVVAEVVRGVDSIVHLGALGSVPRSVENPMASHAANATGTLMLLACAEQAGVSHIVVASSSSVYGLNPALPKSEREWVRPLSPYAVTKLAAEQYSLAFQQSYGMNTIAFRFFNVYGPGQRAGHPYAAVIPTWIDAILHDEPVWINGTGRTSRDFTFVGTVCDLLLEAVVRQVGHSEPVNLAFGTNTTLLDLATALSLTMHRDFEVKHREARPGDVPHSQADNATLLTLFPGVVPTPLEVGLDQTVRWFQATVRS
jgi:UDP-glucose 4-epimerase